MKKKEVNAILKGVAGVGVALGGASAFGEGDVVYAAEIGLNEEDGIENELEEQMMTTESESMSIALENSASTTESLAASDSEVTSLSDSISDN